MIMEDGSLLFASVKDEDIEYFNVQMNGVSCSIESKGDTKRLSFSQRFLLKQTGGKEHLCLTKEYLPEAIPEFPEKLF